jgi:hypothetical protein
MQVIRQYHERMGLERMALLRCSHGLAQDVDVIDEQGLLPVQQIDREEPTSAGNERATIIRREAEDSTGRRFCGEMADYAFG